MRALRRRGWLAIAVAIALLAPSATAAAKSGGSESLLFSALELRGSNGYRVEVITFGNLVILQATSGHVGAAYAVQGRIAANRVEARFGSLGRVAIEFRPKKPANEGKRGRCDFEQTGEFRGTIEFRGERGYTEVDAHRAKGSAFALPDSPACFRASRGGEASSSGFFQLPLRGMTTRLYAISKRSGQVKSVDVLGFPDRGRVLVEASVEEQRGAMIVGRAARALVGGRSAFVSSGPGKHPAFAILRPPKPFSGSATFLETGNAASSWTGDLSAWLPGRGKTSFAGLRFSAGLCRRLVEDPSCPSSPTVQRPLIGML